MALYLVGIEHGITEKSARKANSRFLQAKFHTELPFEVDHLDRMKYVSAFGVAYSTPWRMRGTKGPPCL
jgi:hypothetical protein